MECAIKQFLIISGLPASGKSTIGKLLASSLKMHFLDKDTFLEQLYESRGTGNSEWRSALSREADQKFQVKALALKQVVLASWWKHPKSNDDTGTPIDWLTENNMSCIEIHCKSTPKACFDRFMKRSRHLGHLDAQRDMKSFRELLIRQASLGSLGIGPLIETSIRGNQSAQHQVEDILQQLQQSELSV